MNRTTLLLSLLLLTLGGCDDPASTADEADAGEPTPTAAELFACDTGQFAISKPLVGPGFDPAKGGVLGELQPTYVVHATQLFLRPDRLAEFQAIADPVSAQLDKTEGLLAYSYAGDNGCHEAATLGIWESEAALYKFVGSGAHAAAMGQASEVGYTGRLTHWTVTAEELAAIDWPAARARLNDIDPSAVFPNY
jgi:heme-degrading monooxygenase HmoA